MRELAWKEKEDSRGGGENSIMLEFCEPMPNFSRESVMCECPSSASASAFRDTGTYWQWSATGKMRRRCSSQV